ncbi:hypothetical protein Tco_0875962 [Tanacetum coccineum]|uniref:Uncharacterized protein n=1 Tax=Tanacetum coccineum TaxID=301880 RepID=A0ABQ5BQY4_9ASTR
MLDGSELVAFERDVVGGGSGGVVWTERRGEVDVEGWMMCGECWRGEWRSGVGEDCRESVRRWGVRMERGGGGRDFVVRCGMERDEWRVEMSWGVEEMEELGGWMMAVVEGFGVGGEKEIVSGRGERGFEMCGLGDERVCGERLGGDEVRMGGEKERIEVWRMECVGGCLGRWIGCEEMVEDERSRDLGEGRWWGLRLREWVRRCGERWLIGGERSLALKGEMRWCDEVGLMWREIGGCCGDEMREVSGGGS